MDKNSRIVIIGAGIFGLSTAYQLASEGYRNIRVSNTHATVLDGSSSDISRVIRFDYADEEYFRVVREAHVGHNCSDTRAYFILPHTSSQEREFNLPWGKLYDAAAVKQKFLVLSGELAAPRFSGHFNLQAGRADASKVVVQHRDYYPELGVTFICGPTGIVTRLEQDLQNTIKSYQNNHKATYSARITTSIK